MADIKTFEAKIILEVLKGQAEFGLCNEKIFVVHLGNNHSIQTNELEFVMAFYTEHIYLGGKEYNLSLSDLGGRHIWYVGVLLYFC